MAAKVARKSSKAQRDYDALWSIAFEEALAACGRESSAAEHAANVVSQRRQADKLDSQMMRGLPLHETPMEHMAREDRLRCAGHTREEATRLMFAEDVRAMKAACPEWDADRCAQEVRDRGFYQRDGYSWSIRVAKAVLGE